MFRQYFSIKKKIFSLSRITSTPTPLGAPSLVVWLGLTTSWRRTTERSWVDSGRARLNNMCRTHLISNGPCSIPRLVTLMTCCRHSLLFIPVRHGIREACGCGCISWASMAKRRARPRCFWKAGLICYIAYWSLRLVWGSHLVAQRRQDLTNLRRRWKPLSFARHHSLDDSLGTGYSIFGSGLCGDGTPERLDWGEEKVFATQCTQFCDQGFTLWPGDHVKQTLSGRPWLPVTDQGSLCQPCLLFWSPVSFALAVIFACCALLKSVWTPSRFRSLFFALELQN